MYKNIIGKTILSYFNNLNELYGIPDLTTNIKNFKDFLLIYYRNKINSIKPLLNQKNTNSTINFISDKIPCNKIIIDNIGLSWLKKLNIFVYYKLFIFYIIKCSLYKV